MEPYISSEDVQANNSADDTLLIPSTCEDSPIESYTRKPKRSFVIEPLLFLLCAFAFPMWLLNSLYINERIRNEIAHEMGIYPGNLSANTNCGSNVSNDSETSLILIAVNRAQAINARYNVYSSFCTAIPCLISTLVLGAFSDKAGRRYSILPPVIFMTLGSFVYLVVYVFNLPIWYLLLGSLIGGIGGSYKMLLAGCFAYVADTVEPGRIMFRIAVIELVTFTVGSLGPLVIGNILQAGIGYIYPQVFCSTGFILMCLYAFFFIPETIIRQDNVKLLSTEHLKATVALFIHDSPEGGRRWKLNTLLIDFSFIALAVFGAFSMDTLYLLGPPLCWSQAYIGDFTAIYLALVTLGSLTLAHVLKRCVGDTAVGLVAGISGTARYTYQSFVRFDSMMYFVPALGLAQGLFIPALRAVMSALVLPTQKGAVFSAIAILEVICDLVGTSAFNAIYEQTVNFDPGLVYLVIAGCMLIATVILGVYHIIVYRQRKSSVIGSIQVVVNE